MAYVPQIKDNLVAAATAAIAHPAQVAAPGLAEAPAAAQAPSPAPRPRWRRNVRRALVLAALAASVPVTVTAGVVVLTAHAPPEEAPLPTLGMGPDGRLVDRDPLPRLPATQLQAFSRLGRATTPEDRDNGAVRRAAEGDRFGLNATAARVMATVDGQRVWLIPGNGFLCLGLQPIDRAEVGLACEPEAVALKDGVNVNDGRQIYGLLPDGIDRIEVTDDRGLVHVESVIDNTYVLAARSATIRYAVGDHGGERFRVIGRSHSSG